MCMPKETILNTGTTDSSIVQCSATRPMHSQLNINCLDLISGVIIAVIGCLKSMLLHDTDYKLSKSTYSAAGVNRSLTTVF